MSKRYELIYVDYNDDDPRVHFITIRDDWEGDEIAAATSYIDQDIMMTHEDVLNMFSENFRWTMKKMTFDEWCDYQITLS